MTQLQFPFDADRAMPVELLRDGRGVYGIGVSDLFDLEGVAWSCGIELEPDTFEHPPHALILRPDRFPGTKPLGVTDTAVLQKIAGGFRCGPFMRSHENRLRQFIHHEALNRAGLRWPPQHLNPGVAAWWSADKKQQARNRGIYHGLRLRSLQIINRLIGKALEEAADADAVKAARRFTFKHRESIYHAAALSRRALQLTDTFPLLALALYSDQRRLRPLGDFQNWDAEIQADAARKNCATDLVERGARLRDVAAAMDIPMALRRIKPGAAHLVSDVFCRHPELLHAMPDSLPRSRIWLRVVDWAHHQVNADFAGWTARHAPQIPGSLDEVGFFLADLADWARAGTRLAKADEQEPMGGQFVVRPFTPSMSLNTVTTLSADWHEAVASHMGGPQFVFPAPWYPAAKFGAYEIFPIDNSAELYREGAAMHHCVGTYGAQVKRGGVYVYSVRRNGERLATLALGRNGSKASLSQLRGPCNAQPPKEITAVVQRWLRTQEPLPLPEIAHRAHRDTESAVPNKASPPDNEFEIPF